MVCGFVFQPHVCNSDPKKDFDCKVDDKLSSMSLEEKAGQITLDVIGNRNSVFSAKIPFAFDAPRLQEALIDYHLGSIKNTPNNCALPRAQWNKFIVLIQKIAPRQIRLKIPIISGIEVMHGCSYAT